MAFVRHDTLRRAQRADAKRTADVRSRRVLGAMGNGHLLVRFSEECGGTRIIPAGDSFGPNAQVLVGTPGGGLSAAVISRPPSGAGGLLPPRSTAKNLVVTQDLNEGAYLAFYRTSSTTLDVKRLDRDGDVTETVHSALTVPAGTISATNPAIALISGDATVPDESFILYSSPKVYVVNGTSGSFTEVYDHGISQGLVPRGTYYDPVGQKVMIAKSYSPGIFGKEIQLRSVDTDGTGIATVNTSNQSPQIFENGAAVWDTDRLIAFFHTTSTTWAGCVEVPFDGSAVVVRSGDTFLATAYAASGYGAEQRYHAQLDTSATWYTGARMPLTTGDATSLAWPGSTFYADSGSPAFASIIGTSICLWPVLDSASGTDVHILRVGTGSTPSTSNLVKVATATAGPVDPFVVLPTS